MGFRGVNFHEIELNQWIPDHFQFFTNLEKGETLCILLKQTLNSATKQLF